MKNPIEPNTIGYPLRAIPVELWDKAKHRAITERLTLRELILIALEEYLDKPAK